MKTASRSNRLPRRSGRSARCAWGLIFDLLFLALLISALVPAGLAWIPAHMLPPGMDDAVHLAGFLAVQAHLAEATSAADFLTPWLTWYDSHGVYPPLVYQVMGQLGAWCGGLQTCGMACLNLFWLALAGTALYVLALRLFVGASEGHWLGGRPAGALAALLVTFSPVLQPSLVVFFLDLPALATLLLALACLAGFLHWEGPLVACLAGVAVGAATLTKWTNLFGLFPAVLFMVFRVFRAASPQERRILGRTLALALALLVVGGVLATTITASRYLPTEVFSIRDLLGLVAGLAAGCALVLAYSLPRLGSALPRGLVLASCSGFFLAAPFYWTRIVPLITRLSNDVGDSPLRRDAELIFHPIRLLQLPFTENPLETGALAVVLALVWLAWRGTPEIRFLLVAPILGILLPSLALALPGERYYLPLHALGMLGLAGALGTVRILRLLVFPLLLGLGLWNAAFWAQGLASPDQLRLPPDSVLRAGCGPESLNGRLALLMDQVAEVSGPGIRAVGVFSGEATDWRSPETLQAVAMSQGHTLIVRKLDPISRGGFNFGQNQACRLAALKVPQATMQQLRVESEAPLLALPGRWLLVLEPEDEVLRIPRQQAMRLGPARLLSAPRGFRARLHRVLPEVEGAAR